MMTARDPALGGNHVRGVACLLAAIGLLGLMEVGVKTLTESLSVGQILWARFFFHLLASWPIFMVLGVFLFKVSKSRGEARPKVKAIQQ